MPTLIFVLAFTGVPQVQLAPERGASNGRWDEVFRSLLALKQRACSGDLAPAHRIVAIVLVEVVHARQHVGVAPVVFDRERLAQLHAGQEADGVALFARWAAAAPTALDCGAAVVAGVDALFDPRFEPAHATIQVFASEEEMPESVATVYAPCIRRPAAIFCASAAGAASSASADSPDDHDLIAKIYGSPCGWAEDEERKRIPQLVSALARRLRVTEPARMVSLGSTRLRVSQAVLCDDVVAPLPLAQSPVHAFYNAPSAAPIAALDSLVAGPWKSRPIPRVAFRLHLGPQSTRSAALFAHHFLVETMWLERRRDTPRHHVTFLWEEDADAVSADAADAADAAGPRTRRASSIASLAFESMRGDADLREERRLKGVGGAAASDSYLDALIRLLEAPVSPPAGGVRIAIEADCQTAERLERFTARVVQWELRHLYASRADLVGDITSS